MLTLRIGFTDLPEAIAAFFVEMLSRRYTVIRDDVQPEILIFGDVIHGLNNLKFDGSNCIKLFYTPENHRAWRYQCDYAVTFDHFETDRHRRLPLYVIYDHDFNLIQQRRRQADDGFEEKKFCSFLVKNPRCAKRNLYFEALQNYKRVDAGGPLFNNMGQTVGGSVPEKIAFLNNYKFNLCFENSSHPGYVTEKLLEALCARTIPIYWGSPTVALDFNPKAFLNWHDYEDDHDFIRAIIALDQDDDAYREMYMQPLFPENRPNRYFEMDRFLNWFDQGVARDAKALNHRAT
ncbi:MAG: hypothetical protein I8H77_02000 [Comamonadaceae bacterium]|nr:hypothetical protein [Comamonadaceae bacterium]